jgi:hypothetical protein
VRNLEKSYVLNLTIRQESNGMKVSTKRKFCLFYISLKNYVFFINNMKGVAKLATSSCISVKNLSFKIMSPFAKNCNKFYELMPNYIDKR